jgi:hypothetical protein
MRPKQNESPTERGQARHALRRDLIFVFSALVIATVAVFFFDTGSLAGWIAEHKNTKIEEIIVVTFVLVAGLSFLAIRRWLELSRQLIKYEELSGEMNRPNQVSALLGEPGDLLQSCLSAAELIAGLPIAPRSYFRAHAVPSVDSQFQGYR